MRRCLACVVGLVVALALVAPGRGAFLDLAFAGGSAFDGWNDLTYYRLGGYPGFPGGSGDWPAPIDSNQGGSGDAILSRTAIGEDGGGPYPAAESLYFGSFQQVANRLGGSLRVSDPTPLSGAKTVVFQIQIGEAMGYDFHLPGGKPVLRLNGTPLPAPFVTQLLNRFQSGTFLSPETNQEEPVYVNSWGFQWNVNGLGPITSLEIDFSGVTHCQVYRMRLDQAEDLMTRNIFLPDFRLAVRGQPAFDGVSTAVTHRFAGPPDTDLDIEYNDALGSGSWTAAGTHTTGPSGTVDVTFTKPGNHAAAWSRAMYFRASYHVTE